MTDDLAYVETNFNEIVDGIYEENIIDKIFLDYQSTISREDFIMALTFTAPLAVMFGMEMPELDLNPFDHEYEKEGECAWIFNPNEVREIFRDQIEK